MKRALSGFYYIFESMVIWEWLGLSWRFCMWSGRWCSNGKTCDSYCWEWPLLWAWLWGTCARWGCAEAPRVSLWNTLQWPDVVLGHETGLATWCESNCSPLFYYFNTLFLVKNRLILIYSTPSVTLKMTHFPF